MSAPHATACPIVQAHEQWLTESIHPPAFRETKPLPNSICVLDKPEEIVPASKPSRTAETVAIESRVATIKQRPTSRCFPASSDVNVSAWKRVGFGLAWLGGRQRRGAGSGRPAQQPAFPGPPCTCSVPICRGWHSDPAQVCSKAVTRLRCKSHHSCMPPLPGFIHRAPNLEAVPLSPIKRLRT